MSTHQQWYIAVLFSVLVGYCVLEWVQDPENGPPGVCTFILGYLFSIFGVAYTIYLFLELGKP